MKNKILTAIDLDNNQKSINSIVEEQVILFNKKRIRREYTKIQDQIRIELNDATYKLSEIEKTEIKTRIINDETTIQYRNNQYEYYKHEKENFIDIRNTIHSMNTLYKYAIEIEKAGLQKINNFFTYEEFILESIKNIPLLNTIKKNINIDIDNYISKKLSNKSSELLLENTFDLLLKIRKMYAINTDVDDIELIMEYDYKTNIDFANNIADLIFTKINMGNKSDNILNELLPQNSVTNNIFKNIKTNIISNKMLAILFSKNFISNNLITTLKTTYTNNINFEKVFRTRTLGELLLEITNPENINKTKEEREQIYMTYDGLRPNNEHYYKWNGLQVFDLDLKFWIKKSNGDIEQLKNELHKYLSEFNWYLWIAKSASGNGLHIYTKVTPPHHVYLDVENNDYISKYFYYISYVSKLHNIYDILSRLHKIENNDIDFTDFFKETKGVLKHEFNNVEENKYVDNVVSRITAGIRLAFDINPLINNNFIDLPISLGLSQTLDGFENVETINNKLIRKSKYIKLIDEDLLVKDETQYLSKNFNDEIDLTKFVTLNIDIDEIKNLPKNNINYTVRYNVCNTLASLFGKDGLSIAHKILDSEGCNNIGEINSFYSCALSNRKEPSKLGLEILKKCGIVKNADENLIQLTENSYKNELKEQIENSLINIDIDIDYRLLENQYLSDLQEDLSQIITGDKISIIFSPPGTGKCLGKDTGVLMFDGSVKKVQDIVVGDKLMGIDSTPRNVLSIGSGREELFRVIPKKGTPWVCNKSHILSLIESGKFKQNTIRPNNYDIEDLDITQTLQLPKKHRKKLFRVGLDFPKTETKLSAYFLGLWLGDGSSKNTEIAVGDIDRDVTVPFLKHYASKLGLGLSEYRDNRNKVSSFRICHKNNIGGGKQNPLLNIMREYNLIGNKHIPKDFLMTDRKSRLFLFAGLIDSDGGGSDNTYDYVTKLPQLAEDIKWLCRSLGYYVNHTIKMINDKPYQRLIISGDFTDLPVRIERKKFNRKINKNALVTGFTLESIGEGDYYGFQIDGDNRFLLEDFTVTHNTQWILNLAKQGKRVLLVLPYISVIRNKVETDNEVTTLFDTFYGSADIKTIDYGRNVVTTFDKFSRSNYEKISKMFDYIFIDESHLLFTSSYRIEATSNVIKKIKELFFISSNDPFASKIVLMTGTETGEEYFFNKVAKITRVWKPQHKKEMEFLICGDTLDSLTRLASKASNLILDGYRLMIPTNKGEIYSEKIIGMIEYLLQRPVKYGYYKRSNMEQEICRLINEENTIGDYEIVFCSNYLSVGVDINDKVDNNKLEMKFASIYLGNFSAYEIEQFNARIRKTGIKSIYCITTNKNDGTTNELLLNEPNLTLKITDDEQINFLDDKNLASAKTEFIATYDPVLHKITTPGFSLLNGKIQFNIEEYELISFENKFSECMEHPIKVSRELAKYGYLISVSTDFEGLSLNEQETLKKMGIDAAKNEKIKKHNLLVGTYVDLINQNTFKNEYDLEFNETIDWISKNMDKVIEDRELVIDQKLNGITETVPCYVHVVYDIFASPQQILVRSKEALEKMLRPAKYLISRYTDKKAIDIIYQYVDDNGILKQKNFQRAINLLKLIDSSDANELSEPLSKSLEKMYLFVDKFEMNKDYKIGYETYQTIIDSWTNEYIDTLGIKIHTKYAFDKIKDSLLEMLNDIAKKQTSKNGIRFTYNQLPQQDSNNVVNRRSIDTLITSMFNLTDNLINNKRVIKNNHIILDDVQF